MLRICGRYPVGRLYVTSLRNPNNRSRASPIAWKLLDEKAEILKMNLKWLAAMIVVFGEEEMLGMATLGMRLKLTQLV